MTNPFAAIVGLKTITDVTVPIYVNDISGITTELVSALTTADATQAAKVWGKVQRLALEKLVSMIEGELSKSADFRYTESVSGDLTGDGSGLVLAYGAVYAGYRIRATVKSQDELYLKRLCLDAQNETAVTTIVKVFSAIGVELFSREVTVEPGYNELIINFGTRPQFGRDCLAFVGIDVTALLITALGTGQAWNEAVTLTPATTSVAGSFSLANQIDGSQTGIMLEATVRRSLNDVVARYADRLQWAYAYLCGSLLMTEKLASPNFNLYTNTNRLFTEEQETKLMEEAKTRIRPVAREILKELSKTEVLTDKDDGPYNAGYSIGSFVE